MKNMVSSMTVEEPQLHGTDHALRVRFSATLGEDPEILSGIV
jgi:hypothetical protein